MNNYSAYPAAAAEKRSRVKNTQNRIYAIVGLLCLCLIIIFVGILVPVILLQRKDTDARNAAKRLQDEAAEYWAGVLRNAVVSTITVTYALTGFILGDLRALPSLNATPEERVAGQFFPRFPELAMWLNTSSQDLSMLATAPGGVICQTYPEVPSLYLYDMMYNYTPPLPGTPDLSSHLDDSSLIIFSPRLRPITGFSGVGSHWDVDILQPVYNSTEEFTQNASNFWGYAYAVLSLSKLAEETQMQAWMDSHGLEYLMHTSNDTDVDSILPIYGTNEGYESQAYWEAFAAKGESRPILSSKLDWTIVVYKPLGEERLSKENIAIVVATVVGGSLVIFLVGLAVILVLTQEYDGRRHAPKRPPFAILTVGPCHGNELWNLASEQMIEVTEKLNAVLNSKMVANHAYPTMQIHPYTNSYITRTVSGAVRMAFDILEELQSRPVDANLCRLLGEDGKLLVSCAVHWCTDASVTIEPGSGSYRFEGPDVMFGGRMWFFAAPNTVTLSNPANEAKGPDLANLKVVPFNSVNLRGVKGLQRLFVITDPSSKRLREAATVAVDRLRRARETQRAHLGQKRFGDDDNDNDEDGFNLVGEASSSSWRGDSAVANLNSDAVNSSGSHHSSFETRAAAAAAIALCSPLSATLSSSSVSEYLDGVRSAAVSVPTTPLNSRQDDGRTMIRRPRTLAPAFVTVTNPLDAMGPRVDPMAGVAAPSASTATRGRLQTPTIVPPSSAVSSDGGGGGTGASVTAAPSGSGGSTVGSGSVTNVAAAAAEGGGGGGGPTMQPEARRPSKLKSPLLLSDTCRSRDDSGGDKAHRTAPVLFAVKSPPHTPMATTGAGSGSTSGSRSGGSSVFTATSASGGRPTRHFVRSGGSAGNPLLIDVPVGNPLNDPLPRDNMTTTSGTSTVSTPGAGAALSRSGGGGGSGSGSGGGGGGGESGDIGASFASQEAAAVALFAALYDDGPLGGRHFPSAASSGASASSNSAHASASAAGGGTTTTMGADSSEENGANDTVAIAHALLHPSIPVYMDTSLKAAYEQQALDSDISYYSVRVLIYYFFSSYKMVFRPLAAQERVSVCKRLTAAFGVPQQSILEHLAVRCAMQYLKQQDGTRTLLMEPVGSVTLVGKKRKKGKHSKH